jgi:SAM-dependent methyltransferase
MTQPTTTDRRPLDDIYTPAFYADNTHPEAQDAYRRLGDSILSVVGSNERQSYLDVGCGAGGLVAQFIERGHEAEGFDGSRAAIDAAPAEIRHFLQCLRIEDAPTHADREKRHDVVVSVEVAEHLPESQADTLVRVMTARATDWIVFSAAPPGQGGTDHINLQPYEYWLEKFHAQGWEVALAATSALRAQMAMSRAQHSQYVFTDPATGKAKSSVYNFHVLRPIE